MTPKEIDVQEWLQLELIKREIYPLTIFFSRLKKSILGISFHSDYDLEEILGVIEYDSLCDKSGIIVLRDFNTLILRGSSIMLLIDKFMDYGK